MTRVWGTRQVFKKQVDTWGGVKKVDGKLQRVLVGDGRVGPFEISSIQELCIYSAPFPFCSFWLIW